MNILIAVLIIFIILPSAIKSDFPPHLIPPVKEKKTISIPFQLTSLNQIITNVCLGTPPICYPFKIATNINECFIFWCLVKGYHFNFEPLVCMNGFNSSAREKSINFSFFFN